MDVWQGYIDLDEGYKQIQDLHFSHPHVQDHCLPQDAPLRFLGIVETANIPLFLVAGPSLDVWTDDEYTSEWLRQCLLDDKPPSQKHGTQCQHGILLGVQSQNDGATAKGLRATEILLYAATTKPPQQDFTPPTPPASSSPSPEALTDNASPKIRIYALPLSSDIFNIINHAPAFQAQDTHSKNQGFYFLPPPPSPPQPQQSDTQARKRLKVETLFQDATQARRLQKKQGGAGVSKFMAGAQVSTSNFPSPVLPHTAQLPEKSSAQAPARRKPLARSATTGTLPSLRTPTASSSTSTITTTALSITHRRSSLLRTSSALSPSIDGGDSPAPIPENGDPAVGSIEEANKTSLKRVIMAGMRMYGLELGGKKAPDPNNAGTAPSTASMTNADEYKKIYHQTYRAAAFVFRTHFSNRVLGQDVLRDTVDGFLGRFCRDPLTVRVGGGGGGFFGGEL